MDGQTLLRAISLEFSGMLHHLQTALAVGGDDAPAIGSYVRGGEFVLLLDRAPVFASEKALDGANHAMSLKEQISIRCPACRALAPRWLGRKYDYALWRCARCNVIFVNAEPRVGVL